MMMRRSIISLVLLTLIFVNAADGRPKKQNTRPPQGSNPAISAPAEPYRLWIVVNLFTGNHLKQALIVRDKLAQLGAEGTGMVMPYSAVTKEAVAKLQPAFLALSPNGIPWCNYRGTNGAALERFFQELKVIVEELNVPVIGICGGHQAIALAFGGKVGPIRGDENDCFPYGKNPTEKGRQDVYVIQGDSLFTGMGTKLNLVENHFDEVKRLPPGFIHLAGNGLSPFQIIKHPTKPVYGVQAHTEYFMKSRPDGGTLLRNFLKIANIHNRTARNSATGVARPASEQKDKAGTATETATTPESGSTAESTTLPPPPNSPDQAGEADNKRSESIAQHSIP